jgi:hypothetical protein
MVALCQVLRAVRGTEGNGRGGELKDDSVVLAMCAVDWYAGVNAAIGQRLGPDEVRVTVRRSPPPEEHERREKETALGFQSFNGFDGGGHPSQREVAVIRRGMTARDVVSKFLPVNVVDDRRARLRHVDVQHARLGAICCLDDPMSVTLGELLEDECELMVQELLHPEVYTKGDVCVVLRQWIPCDEPLAPPTELFVKREWGMQDLRDTVAQLAATGMKAVPSSATDVNAAPSSATAVKAAAVKEDDHAESGELVQQVQIVRPWAYQLNDTSSFKVCNWLQPGFRKTAPATDALADPDACGRCVAFFSLHLFVADPDACGRCVASYPLHSFSLL